MSAVLRLVIARWRFAPTRYAGTLLALGLAGAFVIVTAAAGTIAGDQAARASLSAASPSARAFRVTDAATPSPELARVVAQTVGSATRAPVGESLLLGPVRLSGIVVRPAAVVPLAPWTDPQSAARIGRCRPRACPVLLPSITRPLSAPGVHLVPVGSAATGGVASSVPLGYGPSAVGSPPTPVTGDLAGLDSLPGLSSDQRIRNWFAVLPATSLHGWQLDLAGRRLLAAQDVLTSGHPELTVSAPLAAIDAARNAYRSGSERMLPLAGGGAAILLLFVLLSGTGLRADQRAELDRLRAAGARAGHATAFVVYDSLGLAVGGLILGGVAGGGAAAVLAGASNEPTTEVLGHLGGAWLMLGGLFVLAAGLLALATTARSRRPAEVALAATAATLAGLLVAGGPPSGSRALALVCLAATTGALIVWGLAGAALQAGARATRRASPQSLLAIVSLGRSPGAPGLAVGLAAVGLGLAGFALTARATLARGAADQAAAQVPLDVRVGAGDDFRRPLSVLPTAGWERGTGGRAFGVLHATASLAGRRAYESVPILGLPAAALAQLHGWRASDGSAARTVLARRLGSGGAVRTPGPPLPAGASSLRVGLRSPQLAVSVTAVLRDPDGRTVVVPLAVRRAAASGRIPRGDWSELQAIELTEPTGLAVTNGHQNGENPVGVREGAATVGVGPVDFAGRGVHTRAGLAGWTATGAASATSAPTRASGPEPAVLVRFAESGQPGVLRPRQPTDGRALPVLVDPATTATAGPGGGLSLSVNGLPLRAQVVGTVRRFPTLGAGPLLIADAPTLSAAIEAGAPGQGSPDELWIAGADPARLHTLLEAPNLRSLRVDVRAAIEHRIAGAPPARTAGRLLLVEALIVVGLGLAGILLLVSAGSDPALLDDLSAQGSGPAERRRLAAARRHTLGVAALAAGFGVLGLLFPLVLPVTRAIGEHAPEPPYVVVVPVTTLLVTWVTAAVLAIAARRPW